MFNVLRLTPKRQIWQKVKAAWFEAFPQEVDVASLQKRRKETAKLKKTISTLDLSAEQLDALEQEIPEWKRGAVTFLRFLEQPVSETRRHSVSRYIRDRYKDNPDMLALLDEMEGIKDSVQVMQDNFKQRLLYSDSVIVKTSMTAISKMREKLNADAVAEMKRRNPDFDFDTFEKEVRFMFEEIYHEFLRHNAKYLEKVCAGEALGHFRGMINEHQAKFGKPKYTDILNVSFPVLEASFITEDKVPIFAFSMNFQEIYCLVDPKDPESVLDGDERRMVMCDYVVYVMPHPNPDLEAVGHEWLFFNVVQRNKVKQLI